MDKSVWAGWLRSHWFHIMVVVVVVATAQHLIARQRDADVIRDTVETLRVRNDRVDARKRDCLEIYKAEQAKYSNTDRYEYDEDEDVCRVVYRNPQAWRGDDCSRYADAIGKEDMSPRLQRWTFRQWQNCQEGMTDQSF